MNKIDVLYILGTGSKYNNEELRYSLRSLEKFGQNVGRVFITGECPNFIDQNKVIFTPELDIGCPAINHWWKVYQTFEKHQELTGNVLLMYDDVFFAKEFDAANYPYFFRGDLPNYYFGNYQKSLVNAYLFLIEHKKGIKHYGNHCPFIYNRDLFLKLTRYFEDKKLDEVGMSVRSVYGNLFNVGGTHQDDLKIRSKVYALKELIGNRDCFSIADDCYEGPVKEWCEKNLPERSKWEND